MQTGMTVQAKLHIQQVLQRAPDHAEAHYFLGAMAARAGQLQDAARHLGKALELAPANPAGHNNLGVVFKQLGELDRARQSLETAIAQKPDYAEAWVNLGNVLQLQEEPTTALEALERGIALRPDMAEAHHNRGQLLLQDGRVADALQSLERAIALRSNYASAYSYKAYAFLLLHRAEESLVQAERAIVFNPKLADAHYHKALALLRLRRFDSSLDSFAQALALAPHHALALTGRAGLYVELRRFDQALADLEQALSLAPDLLEALENRALAATGAKHYGDAVASYQRILALNPAQPYGKGNLLHAKMLACDWHELEALRLSLDQDVAAGLPAAEPFGYQGIAVSEALLLRCAQTYAGREYPEVQRANSRNAPTPAAPDQPHAPSRITVGYLCGEFRQHATTILMAGVYEVHDRERFRCLAFDSGVADDSDYRRRALAAFEQVFDISGLSDAQAATLIAAQQVDVLVDLNGYYGAERTGVLARRPAPVQVNYLGFPGTLGAPYIDYLVADALVIPPESRDCYAEKIVYLPHCYQANDQERTVASLQGSRVDFGLPATGFVFCCFNNSYKITPQQFACWMRILHAVEGSCLWLLEDAHEVSENLRAAALGHGIDPERLIFAPRLPPAEHLARHSLADLFVDTLPYNAHTTASDALWAGLPVLTCRGTSFPGRVAASLLQAVGLDALVTDSLEAYENLAIELARAPDCIAALKSQLQGARQSCPLFDTLQKTRELESAFSEMVSRQRRGEAPAHFTVRNAAGS